MHDVAEALRQIQQRVEAAATAAGRDPSSVRLIAVSKRQPDERLWAAYEAGQRDFGENYVQELERKQALLPDDARFHLIGHVQSNKAKRAAAAHLVHTVDSAKLARALAKGGGARALIQVRQGGEDSKSGIEPAAVEALLEELAAQATLRIDGLMSIPPPGEPRYFAELAELAERLRGQGYALPELSMGMSSDFEAAIAAGATLVRVGSAIFGARNLP